MAVPAAVEAIQATLAPAFLISGASIFLNFSQARLFRVMDRVRASAHAAHPEHAARGRLLRRARILRNGIAFGVLTIAFAVAAAILLMASELFLGEAVSRAAPYCFAFGLLSLFLALGFVFSDTVISVASVEREKA